MKGKIIIFKNDRKKADNHPEYVGTLTDESGSESEVALWIKEGKNGKFFAGTIQDKREKKEYQKEQVNTGEEERKDGLPF
jgi:hypothetical protein